MAQAPKNNLAPLHLHIPEPKFRPGDVADFSDIIVPEVDANPRPDEHVMPADIHPLAYGLVRVLGDDHQASGSWNPGLDADTLRVMLRKMLLLRAFDDRMFRAQRQGKTSFYMKSFGEEATSVATTMAMYSAKEYGFFSVSGNLTTQYPQAVGWAMASASRVDTRISAVWCGDGSTAEGDFHSALTFAAVYNAPVIFQVVNNQWAISSFSGFAGSERTTFAARVIGYGIAGLRVDGNDALAVYAADRPPLSGPV